MPRSDAGWTDSSLELVRIRLLDKTQAQNEEGRAPEASQFVDDLAADEWLLKTAAKALGAEGLAQTQEDFDGGITLVITSAGEALAQTRKERRLNPRLRSIACREALLAWCYSAGQDVSVREFSGDTRAHFEGDAFTPDEVAGAALDLREKGLIIGKGTVQNQILRASITAAGKSVVEDHDSSIRSYETRGQTSPSRTTIHIEGSILSGQLTVGDHNQVIQNNGASTSEFTDLIKAVLEAAAGTSEEGRVGKLVTQLQLEADEQEPEPTFVSKTLDRLEDAAAKTTSTGLVYAVTQLAQWFHSQGIPQALGLS